MIGKWEMIISNLRNGILPEVSGCGLRVSSCGFLVAGYEFLVTSFGFWVYDRLLITEYRLPASGFGNNPIR